MDTLLIFFLNRSFLNIVEKNQKPVYKNSVSLHNLKWRAKFQIFRLHICDSDRLKFIQFSGYKFKIRLVSILRKREDQALISISTILKFSALSMKNLLCLWNVVYMKCLFLWNVLSLKCFIYEISYLYMILLSKKCLIMKCPNTINMPCLFDCLSVCIQYTSTFFVVPHMIPGKVYEWSKFKKIASNKIRFP